MDTSTLDQTMRRIGASARAAARQVARADDRAKAAALRAMAAPACATARTGSRRKTPRIWKRPGPMDWTRPWWTA